MRANDFSIPACANAPKSTPSAKRHGNPAQRSANFTIHTLHHERRARYLTLMIIAVLVPMFTAVALSVKGATEGKWAASSLAFGVICGALVPLCCETALGILDPLNPRNLFLLFFAFQFGVYPLYVLGGGPSLLTNSTFFDDAAKYYVEAESLAALGLLCYLLGYYSRLGIWGEHLIGKPRRLDVRRVKKLSLCLFVVGYAFAAAFFWKAGGVRQFLEDRETWRALGVSGSGPFLTAINLWLPTSALLLMVQSTSWTGPWRKTARTAIFAFLGLCLVPVYLLGFRSLIIIPLLQSVAVVHYLKWRLRLRSALLLACLAVVCMTFYGLARGDSPVSASSVTLQSVANQVLFRCTGADIVAVILRDTKFGDYEFGGKAMVETATILIPHGIWSGKPLSWGEQFSTKFFASYLALGQGSRDTWGGVSPTAIGYFYLQCGWIGVVLGMFAVGAWTKAMYFHGRRFAGSNTGFLLFVLLLPPSILVVEAPQNAFNTLVITLVCAYLPIMWAAKLRTPL